MGIKDNLQNTAKDNAERKKGERRNIPLLNLRRIVIKYL